MNQGIKYTVDIVFCIDATGSMTPIIERVKAAASKFHSDVTRVLDKKEKVIDTLRARVIAFRDYGVDGSQAMVESPFFELPRQQDEFSNFLSSIRAEGGGDEPENGLEALALALKSDWTKVGDRKRQVVVLWTDASAHPLEKAMGPSNMPKSLDQLADMWEGQSYVSASARRLLLYAPETSPWSSIGDSWEQTIYLPSVAGDGLSEVEYESILSTIAESV
jgi:hypothetical protein